MHLNITQHFILCSRIWSNRMSREARLKPHETMSHHSEICYRNESRIFPKESENIETKRQIFQSDPEVSKCIVRVEICTVVRLFVAIAWQWLRYLPLRGSSIAIPPTCKPAKRAKSRLNAKSLSYGGPFRPYESPVSFATQPCVFRDARYSRQRAKRLYLSHDVARCSGMRDARSGCILRAASSAPWRKTIAEIELFKFNEQPTNFVEYLRFFLKI